MTYTLLNAATIAAITFLFGCSEIVESPPSTGVGAQVRVSSETIELIAVDGLRFRDLNRNGSLDPYEDWRLSSEIRAANLLSQMTLEEKAGQLLHGNILPDFSQGRPSAEYSVKDLETMLHGNHVRAAVSYFDLSAKQFAQQNNVAQRIAEKSRLGIPMMISTDPRHHFQGLAGGSMSTDGFSRWPEALGFAAIDDPDLMRVFGEIAAMEYRATGFSLALSPMADLASEPRWPRFYGTFGEDPEVISRMVGAYIEGFQGGVAGPQRGSVAAVVKHWVGYGAAANGFDSHNYYGRYGDLQTDEFALHLRPYQGAFDAQVSSVMPAYSIFDGLEVNGVAVEPFGAGYSKVLLQNLLRGEYGYDGVILSDWAITNDCSKGCRDGSPAGQRPSPADISTGWGVQDLTRPERFALAMDAGIDQFGGVSDAEAILSAISDGLISIERVDHSVQRILKRTFDIGLFDNPFVYPEALDTAINSPDVASLALRTQSRAMVMLKQDRAGPVLSKDIKSVFLFHGDAETYLAAGYEVTDAAEKADLIIARIAAPYENLHPGYFFGSEQHEGRLDFSAGSSVIAELERLAAIGPLVVDVFLDRPAILTDILELADVLIVDFGASDVALIKALDGSAPPQGRLPFELPSSQRAVEQQSSGKPADSVNPLFPLGYKLLAK